MLEKNWPQLALINWFGHWPGSGVKGKLQRVLSFTILLTTVALFIAEMISTREYFRLNDIETGLVNLNELLSGCQCYFTSLIFIVYSMDLAQVLSLVDALNERVIAQVGEPALIEISRKKKIGRLAHNIFFWSFVLIFHWALRPLLHLAMYGETTFIVHSWLPFNNTTLNGFFGNFFCQLIPCTSFCMGFCMFGSVFVSLSELILGQINVLKYRLKTIKYGKPTTEHDLHQCVQHHEDILRICQKFQHITAIPLIAFCLLTVLVLCVILFELTMVESTTSERMINVLEEAQQEFLFLATYCWYGNEITYQCTELVEPGYMADWYNGSKNEKKILLNIMTRSMVPGYFGGFVRIDIYTFINVIKAAFSYFNFLGAVNAKSVSDRVY